MPRVPELHRLNMKRILVTGPVNDLDSYVAAARAASWEAVAWPLLRIEQRTVEAASVLADVPDWICITSSNAVDALDGWANERTELRRVPCAVVGDRTAERMTALGFRIELEPVRDAAALGELVAREAGEGARILWPRGSRSDALGVFLRAHGLVVGDPVVYASVSAEPEGCRPSADAVLFASPSAVEAWFGSGSEPVAVPKLAVAIGKTTLRALQGRNRDLDFDTICLDEPLPAALTRALAARAD